MLTFDQIKTIYKSQEPDNQKIRLQLVEYIQYELLDSIFKQRNSERLSFMGGTSIRVVYGGNRFSEDLDFDNLDLSFEDFKEMLSSVVIDMKIKGFDIEFRFVESNAFHCYIRFPKILSDNSLSLHGNEKILVKVDTLKRSTLIKPQVFLMNRFELYRNIFVNSPAVLLSEKLIAIRDRKREKGRDFYDASFLYGFTEPD
ncbi:MAG: nucleotidyl transferase AbiEii/AbiGii toxin family protein, partial [Candidatus Taylorbacteria bacterium]|nr:nucleotidyl transferase AbiEii/AbiGii toxin family protein [Candidatus Taylorbacteria bacterium]